MGAYFKDNEEKRKYLVSRGFNLANKGTIENSSVQHFVGASHCADSSTGYANLEGDLIKEVKHDSKACVITTSAIDILMEMITGKNVNDAIRILDNYYNYINKNEHDIEALETLVVFDGVIDKGNRYKCLELPYILIKEMLEK